MLSSKIIFLSVLGVLAIVASTNADCCPCHSLTHECKDRTSCGYIPNLCCGHGKCNFFCCNCEGGCRKHDDSLEAEQSDNTTFWSIVDKDSSGDVDYEELENFSVDMPQNMLIYTIFTLLDENKDDHISAEEFDKSNLK